VGFAEPSHAAVPKAPAKVTVKSAALVKGSEQTQVKITWKKINGVSGYQIARKDGNGSWKNIKNVNKAGTVTFTNTGLKASTKYTYRVRAYKTYKQYYNTTKNKWVSSKPAKKHWKGKLVKTAYKYGKWSGTKAITTKAKLNQTLDVRVYRDDLDLTGTGQISAPAGNRFAHKINATASSGLPISYSSSDTKIATVDKNGNVTLVSGAEGGVSVTITIKQVGNAKYNSVSKTITYKVYLDPNKPVPTITVAENPISVTAGETKTISASSNSSAKLNFSSKNNNIATVDANGKVTGKAPGTTYIVVKQDSNDKYNGASKTISVTVKAKQVITVTDQYVDKGSTVNPGATCLGGGTLR